MRRGEGRERGLVEPPELGVLGEAEEERAPLRTDRARRAARPRRRPRRVPAGGSVAPRPPPRGREGTSPGTRGRPRGPRRAAGPPRGRRARAEEAAARAPRCGRCPRSPRARAGSRRARAGGLGAGPDDAGPGERPERQHLDSRQERLHRGDGVVDAAPPRAPRAARAADRPRCSPGGSSPPHLVAQLGPSAARPAGPPRRRVSSPEAARGLPRRSDRRRRSGEAGRNTRTTRQRAATTSARLSARSRRAAPRRARRDRRQRPDRTGRGTKAIRDGLVPLNRPDEHARGHEARGQHEQSPPGAPASSLAGLPTWRRAERA